MDSADNPLPALSPPDSATPDPREDAREELNPLPAPEGAEYKPPAAPNARIRPELAVRILAGLETGILGGLLMIAWVALASAWDGEPWYEVPNLWASAIWGRIALYRRLSLMTLGGSCFQIVMGSLIGAIFSMIFGTLQGLGRLLPPGLMTGAAWFILFNWRNRIFAMHAPQPEVLVAYALFGVMLARTGRRGRVLQRGFDGPDAGGMS